MFEQLSEQFQQSLKPASELLAVNAGTLEKLVQKQTAFVTGVMNDSVTYTRNLTNQKDLDGLLKVQKIYIENLQEQLTSCAKDTYAVMSEAQEKGGEIVKDIFSLVREKTEEIVTKSAKATSGGVK